MASSDDHSVEMLGRLPMTSISGGGTRRRDFAMAFAAFDRLHRTVGGGGW